MFHYFGLNLLVFGGGRETEKNAKNKEKEEYRSILNVFITTFLFDPPVTQIEM